MRITEQDLGRTKVLALAGDLDQEAASEAESAFAGFLDRAGEKTRLVLDLSEVDYLSGRGLTAILGLARGVNLLDGRLVVCCPGGYAAEVLASSGLDRILLIAPNRREALERI